VRHAVADGISAGRSAENQRHAACRQPGGTGIFTAILVAIYCVEMMRFLKAHNIGIRLPDQVPPMIKNSFDLLIPVLVVVLTLYPLSLLIQSEFGMLIPQAIMSVFKPLVSAADSCLRSCWRC
jgi:PTS system cellobiose-specific IIC component